MTRPRKRARQDARSPAAGQRRAREVDIIQRLRSRLATSSALVDFGIGDDAAVIRCPKGRLVLSVDVQVEHVHFERAWLSVEELGARALHVAASDLAAMGARPLAALSSIVAPTRRAASDIEALARGQADAARELRCPIIGGNLSAGDALSLTITVLGEADRPTLRTGARRGDQVWLLGDVGAAAAGLRLIRSGRSRPRAKPASYCVRAWRAPRAAIAQGRRVSKVASAMIDVSDGLAGDALQLARASKKRLVFDGRALEKALPAALVEVSAREGWNPLELALGGGEDYALLATGAAHRRPRGARAVGWVHSGRGVKLELENGSEVSLDAGYDHFAIASN